MARNRKSSRRSTNRRPEPDSGSGSRNTRDDSHRRDRADRFVDRKSRSTRHSNSETRPRKHRKHRRHEVVTDTDGDYLMDKTQPGPKHDRHQGQPATRLDTASSSSKERHPAERPQRLPDHNREKPHERREAKKDYHFRRHLLALLEQQRQVVEAWADSLGAGGPAEPMEWQPEQERVVYFARMPVEDDCYADRWRIGGTREAYPTLGSWASERWLDGSLMGGAPAAAAESGLAQEIE
ncbi:hypothetical protein CGLO_13573 [Colletotrichum gloeosporioides Cg-14]|uniref:Uncharacterized protein n=1 Tax=Colletotrichum gloeosporioides (strain Cg-14) TaxID=1237896 RepID=T0JWD6_COLGC|nr:hypothetical protein CGLO_13573 [Colletotrichum gloeosporioides Cg-14]